MQSYNFFFWIWLLLHITYKYYFLALFPLLALSFYFFICFFFLFLCSLSPCFVNSFFLFFVIPCLHHHHLPRSSPSIFHATCACDVCLMAYVCAWLKFCVWTVTSGCHVGARVRQLVGRMCGSGADVGSSFSPHFHFPSCPFRLSYLWSERLIWEV